MGAICYRADGAGAVDERHRTSVMLGHMASDLRRTRRSRSPASGSVAAVIREPQANWVRLRDAPWYCTTEGYIASGAKWADVLHAQVKRTISRPRPGPPNPNYPELIGLAWPEWSLERSDAKWLLIGANGITTYFALGQ